MLLQGLARAGPEVHTLLSAITAGTTGPCPDPCPRCGEDRLTNLVTDARGRQGVCDVCAYSCSGGPQTPPQPPTASSAARKRPPAPGRDAR